VDYQTNNRLDPSSQENHESGGNSRHTTGHYFAPTCIFSQSSKKEVGSEYEEHSRRSQRSKSEREPLRESDQPEVKQHTKKLRYDECAN
jgi:hypothetical protein